MIPKLILAAVVAALFSHPALAQSAPGFSPPRTPWGAPDIQGFWNSTSITSLQRPPGVEKLTVSEAEAREIVEDNPLIMLTRQEAASQGLDPNNTQILSDKNTDRGYNTFWIDPGTKLATVKGELRTSWIVEPADGHIPFKPGAQRWGGSPPAASGVNFDGPETRPLFDRCLMTETMGGPIMQNAMYNSTLQIVQTPEAVMIAVEMVHHARIIPIVANAAAAKHGPDVIPKWTGDSVGWYEGEELVVETRNVHPLQPSLISPSGVLIERLSRWDEGQVLYTFEVRDPSLYTQPWRGEMALNHSQPMYEFACHEGNYAMAGMLAGARALEAKGIAPTLGPGIAAGLSPRRRE